MTDIVLKDRNGEDVTYSGIETVTFDTPDEGVQATFTHGVEMQGVEVDLDLASGDQQIGVPDGYLVKSATIKKPETLLPENIAEGVNIAGIIGTLAAGKDIKIAGGSFDGNGGVYTLTHGLGVTPDLIFLYTTTYFTSGSYMEFATVVGSKLKSLTNLYGYGYIRRTNSRGNATYPLDTATTSNMIYEGKADTIKIASTATSSTKYYWLAIGGLT